MMWQIALVKLHFTSLKYSTEHCYTLL